MTPSDIDDPRMQGLLQMIQQNDDKQEEGHGRLRQSIRDIEGRVESNFAYLRDHLSLTRSRLDTLAATPVDATKLVLAPRVVVGIVVASLTVAGGVWASTYGLRSDVRDILTRMEAQKTAWEATAKLQELQSTTLRTTVDDMKRRQELQQYEIQGLKEVILTGKGRSR